MFICSCSLKVSPHLLIDLLNIQILDLCIQVSEGSLVCSILTVEVIFIHCH